MKNNNFDIIIGNISVVEFDIFGGIDNFYANDYNSFIIDKETRKMNKSDFCCTNNDGELFMAMRPLYLVSILSCIKYMKPNSKNSTPISEITSFRKSRNTTDIFDMIESTQEDSISDSFFNIDLHDINSILGMIDVIDKPLKEYDFNNCGFRYMNITAKFKLEYISSYEPNFGNTEYDEKITFLDILDI